MNPYVPEKLPLTSIRWEDTYRERNRSLYCERLKPFQATVAGMGGYGFFFRRSLSRRLKILKQQERSWTFTTG